MLGERLKRSRKEANLSQEQLASMIGVSRKSIMRWETGERVPDSNNVIALAKALETTTAYLMGESENPDKDRPKRLSFLPPRQSPNPPAPGTIDAEIDELEKRMLEEDAKDPSRLFLSLRTTIKHREELGPNDKAFIVALLKWGIARLEGRPEGDIENFPGEDATDDDF